MILTSIALGQYVIAGPRLRRVFSGHGRKWECLEWDKKWIVGIYIGCRTYHNGRIEIGDFEAPNIFIRESSVKVALIVQNSRKNPVPVLFDSMKPT